MGVAFLTAQSTNRHVLGSRKAAAKVEIEAAVFLFPTPEQAEGIHGRWTA
jgi:hypothetical protein